MLHTQKIDSCGYPTPLDMELDRIDELFEGYKNLHALEERQKFFNCIQEALVAIVISVLGFDRALSIIKEPTIQKEFVLAISKQCNELNRTLNIGESALIKILLEKIHPDYQREFALFTLSTKAIIKLLDNDPTSDRLKLILGKDNQVNNLKAILNFEDFKKLYNFPYGFREIFSAIRQSERISFIKDFVGIDNLPMLYCPLLTLSEILRILIPHERYDFLITELGINNLKKIIYDSKSRGFYLEEMCNLLSSEDIISLSSIFVTEDQTFARNKLDTYRDAIENTNFVTTLGKCSNSLHGCVEVEIRKGKKKLISATAKSILDILDENYHIFNNHIASLLKVQGICTNALEYKKINSQYQEGVIGTALKYSIWMSRTDEAMELYAMIAEDQIKVPHFTFI